MFDLLESYNLETKHYVILVVLGIVEIVLFGMMFYNCYAEYKKKRNERKYAYQNVPKSEEDKPKPSLMEIFSVDMTLKRDSVFCSNCNPAPNPNLNLNVDNHEVNNHHSQIHHTL